MRIHSSNATKHPFHPSHLFAIALCCLSLTSSSGAAPEPPATSDVLHKMFDDAQYQPLLQKLARVLQLKGDAAKAYDRVDLETLRADALLQLKQQATAVASLNDAVKAIDDQTPEKVAARARATQILLKHAQAYQYTPKPKAAGDAPKPINILDMTKRKDAFIALLADMNAEVTAKIKTAKAGKTLPPIIEAVRSITSMRAVELMAQDSDSDSQKVADALAAQAKTMMTDTLTPMTKLAKEIDDDANTLVLNPQMRSPGRAIGGTTTDTFHKRGLTTKSTSQLREIIDTSVKIASVAKDFSEVSKDSAAGFKELADNAEKTAKAASVTLNADYASLQGKR